MGNCNKVIEFEEDTIKVLGGLARRLKRLEGDLKCEMRQVTAQHRFSRCNE